MIKFMAWITLSSLIIISLSAKAEGEVDRLDPLNASALETRGDAAWTAGMKSDAITLWQQARRSWASKRFLLRTIEPELFATYKGYHRFNPLQQRIEAKLIAAYVDAGRLADVTRLRQTWVAHHSFVQKAHGDEVARIFRTGFRRYLQSAETLTQQTQLAENYRLPRPCESDLKAEEADAL